MISSSNDTTIKIWNVDSGEISKNIQGHFNTVYTLAISKKGDKFASGSYDGFAKVWDLKTRKGIVSLKEHVLSIDDLAFSPDGARVASCSQDSVGTELYPTYTQLNII